MEHSLAYLGRIVTIKPIQDADKIVSCEVVCGKGGKWSGVVQKDQYEIGEVVVVYLPDAILKPSEELSFMSKHNWRVKMSRFRGAPSEVLITKSKLLSQEVGYDCTQELGVTKYYKPLPASLQGKASGIFPSFIPKTDEPNYQTVPELVEMLQGKPYIITEKADGSSTTAYRWKGHFGVCSRNYELVKDETNAYWQVALKYNLDKILPEGYAIQWETIGEKIQGNPMGIKGVDGRAFTMFDISNQSYLEHDSMLPIEFPFVRLLDSGEEYTTDKNELSNGSYENGKLREGIVIRSTKNLLGYKPISFKVINLDYET